MIQRLESLPKGSIAMLRNGMPSRRRSRTCRRRFVPGVNLMEDRTLLSTLMVTNNNDSGKGSLRAEIAAATSGDAINFSSKLKGETITLTSGELLITVSVTINGLGANRLSVSGNNASRVIEIAAGLNVTINGLTITDGYALDQGGGILNDGSNLTLSGDVLSQNVAIDSATNDFTGALGGALDSVGGTLNITGCQITANQALGGASASRHAAGGGICLVAGTLTISNSAISGNLAQGGDNSSVGYAFGGAIYSAGSATISTSTISGNTADGGANSSRRVVAAAVACLVTSATITGCNISDNSAVRGGAERQRSRLWRRHRLTSGALSITAAASAATWLGAVTTAALAAPSARASSAIHRSPQSRASPTAPSATTWLARATTHPATSAEGGGVEIQLFTRIRRHHRQHLQRQSGRRRQWRDRAIRRREPTEAPSPTMAPLPSPAARSTTTRPSAAATATAVPASRTPAWT